MKVKVNRYLSIPGTLTRLFPHLYTYNPPLHHLPHQKLRLAVRELGYILHNHPNRRIRHRFLPPVRAFKRYRHDIRILGVVRSLSNCSSQQAVRSPVFRCKQNVRFEEVLQVKRHALGALVQDGDDDLRRCGGVCRHVWIQEKCELRKLEYS